MRHSRSERGRCGNPLGWCSSSRPSCSKSVSGVKAANPPAGLGPSWIVQRVPVWGASCLATGTSGSDTSGHCEKVSRARIAQPWKAREGLPVSFLGVDAEKIDGDPIGAPSMATNLWLMGKGQLLRSGPWNGKGDSFAETMPPWRAAIQPSGPGSNIPLKPRDPSDEEHG